MNRLLIAALCGTLAAAPAAASQTAAAKPSASRTFKTRLSPVPVDAAMVPNVAGLGSVTATLNGSTLAIQGTFDGLRTAATVARIHKGAKAGIRGAAVFDLTVTPATNGTITGTVELTPSQIADLEQGRLYVQLHSEKAPDGNLWGWLMTPQENRR